MFERLDVSIYGAAVSDPWSQFNYNINYMGSFSLHNVLLVYVSFKPISGFSVSIRVTPTLEISAKLKWEQVLFSLTTLA